VEAGSKGKNGAKRLCNGREAVGGRMIVDKGGGLVFGGHGGVGWDCLFEWHVEHEVDIFIAWYWTRCTDLSIWSL